MTFTPRNNNRSFPRRNYDPTKEIRFSHTPFSIEAFENDIEKLEAACDKNGKITITHTDKKTDEFEQVVIPASLVFKLVNMLETTRSVKFRDRVKDDANKGPVEG